MNTAKLVAFLGAWSVLTLHAGAYNAEHGPFAPGAEPKPFPLLKCSVTAVTNSMATSQRTFLCSPPGGVQGAERLAVRAVMSEEGHAMVTIEGANTEVLWGPNPIAVSWLGAPEVRSGDLNRDGSPDFVLFFWCGGNGLASGNIDVLFILSSENGYRGTSLTTLFPNENWSFVDLKGDGGCQYVHTSFVYGEPGEDGKAHNYWVYNVLGFDGGEVRIVNDAFPQFPKWVWYSFAPNHAETTQLTREQKDRLWQEQGTLKLTRTGNADPNR